jgi:hypothetical protein
LLTLRRARGVALDRAVAQFSIALHAEGGCGERRREVAAAQFRDRALDN